MYRLMEYRHALRRQHVECQLQPVRLGCLAQQWTLQHVISPENKTEISHRDKSGITMIVSFINAIHQRTKIPPVTSWAWVRATISKDNKIHNKKIKQQGRTHRINNHKSNDSFKDYDILKTKKEEVCFPIQRLKWVHTKTPHHEQHKEKEVA